MGGQLPAHFANAGFRVLLYDLDDELVRGVLARARKIKPAAFYHRSFVRRIEPLTYDAAISRLSECDWVPESVADRLSRRAMNMPGVAWVPFEQDMHRRIRQARLVVCMGGYNTLCELVALRKTALVVPRVKPRLEQAIRAEQWARRGAIFSLHPSALTPDTLADRVVHLLNNSPAVADPDLDLGGLDRVADRFRAFWQEDVCNATAVCL